MVRPAPVQVETDFPRIVDGGPTLVDLLSPVSSDSFFREYWENRPAVLSARESRTGFDLTELLTLSDVDALVASTTGTEDGWLTVVRNGSTASISALRSPDRLIDRTKVADAHRQGFTILLTKLHRRSQRIAALCRHLEADFHAAGVALASRVGANAYLTPPSEQGFPVHYDDHDVIVIQLHGHKHWTIREPVTRFPATPPEGPLPPDGYGPPVAELSLGPGDVLYVPRGFPHEVRAEADRSLHLTISFYPLRWLDLFRSAIAQDAACREALPPGTVPDVRDALDRATGALTRDTLDAALRQCAEKYFESLATLAAGDAFSGEGDDGADGITATTVVTRRPGVFVGTAADRDGVSLLFPGAGYRAPLRMRDALEFVATRETFTPGDLPDVVHAGEKRALVAELVRQRVLRVVR